MQKIIEALERKHPGCEVVYVHLSPPVLEISSEMENEIAEAIEIAEPMNIAEAFK